MLTPDFFYGKSDKLIEMYQELEDWIISDIATVSYTHLTLPTICSV